MKKLCLFCPFTCSLTLMAGKRDSLVKIIQSQKDIFSNSDTASFMVLYQYGMSLQSSLPDSALSVFRLAIPIALPAQAPVRAAEAICSTFSGR